MYSLGLKSCGSMKLLLPGFALRALFILGIGVLEDDVPDSGPDDVLECIELLE
jgi:hypothetical protein